MWATLVTVFAALNGAVTFFKSMFGKSSSSTTAGVEDANTQAVTTLNRTGKVETDTARQAQASIDKGNQDATETAADRHDQLAAAHGLRARAAVLEATRNDGEGSGADATSRAGR
jgi:hypothetical protein